jgi:glycosyltransferase involved in cell wall biosynthesis
VGQLPNEQLPEYLNAADLYVSTSLSDAGLAASTAEAMACGLPVIVTDSAENKLWVREREGGFVIPVQNPQILAEKVIALLQNPSTGKQWGNFNRRVIQERNNYYVEMGRWRSCMSLLLSNMVRLKRFLRKYPCLPRSENAYFLCMWENQFW